jgi:hypothetical protein
MDVQSYAGVWSRVKLHEPMLSDSVCDDTSLVLWLQVRILSENCARIDSECRRPLGSLLICGGLGNLEDQGSLKTGMCAVSSRLLVTALASKTVVRATVCSHGIGILIIYLLDPRTLEGCYFSTRGVRYFKKTASFLVMTTGKYGSVSPNAQKNHLAAAVSCLRLPVRQASLLRVENMWV